MMSFPPDTWTESGQTTALTESSSSREGAARSSRDATLAWTSRWQRSSRHRGQFRFNPCFLESKLVVALGRVDLSGRGGRVEYANHGESKG